MGQHRSTIKDSILMTPIHIHPDGGVRHIEVSSIALAMNGAEIERGIFKRKFGTLCHRIGERIQISLFRCMRRTQVRAINARPQQGAG